MHSGKGCHVRPGAVLDMGSYAFSSSHYVEDIGSVLTSMRCQQMWRRIGPPSDEVAADQRMTVSFHLEALVAQDKFTIYFE